MPRRPLLIVSRSAPLHGPSGLIPLHGPSGLIPLHGPSGLLSLHGPSGLLSPGLLLALCSCTSTTPTPTPEVAPPDPVAEIDLWAGVPPISPDPADVTTLLKPVDGPKPPPSVSEKVELPFPPPAPPSKPTQDKAPDGPLQVLRTSPTQKAPGDVGTVTAVFNQAMVPLAAVDELKLQRSPMAISPQPPGKFRWLGTQMIAFEAEGRMPYSTTYTAEVAAGETSTAGTKLGKPVQWKFSTPTLEFESVWPSEWGQSGLDSLVIVRLNQEIQADKLAAALTLRGGGKQVAVSVVPPGSYATLDPPYRSQAEGGRAGRTLVLRPGEQLAPNTKYTLTIPAGAYGEGPNASKKLTTTFNTYPPLTLRAPHCKAEYSWDCHPSRGILVYPSTPLVDEPNLLSKVRVTPEVPELKISASGGELRLTGKFRGLTSYTVEVDAGVRDVHGQTLAKPFRAAVKLPALDVSLKFEGVTGDPVVLEPSHAGVIDLKVTGLTEVEVRARSLSAAELPAVLKNRRQRGERDGWISALESAPTTSFAVASSRMEAVILPQKTRELGRMPGSFLLLGARSNPQGEADWRYRQQIDRIVEVTRLGVSAAIDSDSGVILVTDVDTGEPVGGVDVSLHRRNGGQLWTGTTDARGLAELSYPEVNDYNPLYVLASAQGDVSYTPLEQALDGSWGNWRRNYEKEDPRVFFFTDRQPYKPGDTVHLSGILRQETHGPEGAVGMYRADVTCQYVVRGPRGHEVAKGQAKVNRLGTFSVDVALPPDTDLGDHSFELMVPTGSSSGSRSFGHGFSVAAYRAPEFEVKVERAADSTLVYGDTLEADIRGVYLHGAPMVGAEVSYTLRRSDAGFRPPGSENEPFSFGPQPRPWWWGEGSFGGGGSGGMLVRQGVGTTDARGVVAVSHALLARETPWDQKKKQPKVEEAKPDKPLDPPVAGTYTLEAQVTDRNRQALAGRQSFVVHGADEYVGVRSDRTVYKEGEQARVEAIVTDVAGKRVRGRKVQLALVRSETKRTAVETKGKWSYKYETVDVPSGSCTLTSDAAPVSCEIPVGQAGSYVARAEVSDAKGRPALTRHNIYVHGKDAVVWNQDQRRVDIVPDKRSYEPGESATLLVRSPFDRARGLVTIEREGLVEHREVSVEGGMATLNIPLSEAMIPGAHVSVLLIRGRVDVPGAPADQDLGRPAVAVGRVELKVASTRKQVALTLTPDRGELAPKDTLKLEIQARDADGKGQKAMVAVMIVDEGVLSLMAYKTPDPLAFFHHAREPGVSLYDLRTYLLARPESAVLAESRVPDPAVDEQNGSFLKSPYGGAFAVGNDDADVWGGLTGTEIGESYGVGGLGLVGTGRGGGGTGEGTIGLGNIGIIGKGGGSGTGSGYGSSARMKESANKVATRHRGEEGKLGRPLNAGEAMAQAISLRAQFATTAYFNPEVAVGETGVATIEVPMPENLTSFRVMAVAVDPDRPDRFGSAETRVKVRKPIMLRPSLPRFANFGDSFQASVMVDNQTEEPQALLVGARGTNVGLPGATTVPVEIPAGESREVRFPMTTERVGTMRLQFAALSNGGRDATEMSLPVLYPATRQAFADYGVTDTSVLRALKVPEGALPGFGGLEVSLSSTALKGLEDAVQYLVEYAYECTEQVSSRLLPIFVLGPVLEQFPIATVRDLERRKEIAGTGIARILGRQNNDGGFRYWDENDRSSPYLTAWATFALLEGKRAGFKVDEDSLEQALGYLSNFIQYGESTPWGRYYDHTSRAFALWLLSREGRGGGLFDRVYAKRKEIPLYARMQLMSAAHKLGRTGERDALLKDLRARVTETARTAHFAESTSQAEAEGLQILMHSSVQTDAVALMALLEIDPADPLLPKVMAGILDDRDPKKGGRWGTTHANAWALLAASRYFTVVEKAVPDYVARIWLDTAFAGEQVFKGRSMTTTEQEVPMATLQKDLPREVLLAKDGPGKLYYRLGLRYAPADLVMKAESQGFSVFRTYEPLAHGGAPADPETVRRMPDGSYEIKAGSLVRVNLTLVAKDRANFVVVDDPLPAGFEGQNASFATTLRDVSGGVTRQRYDRGDDDIWGGAEDGWWWWRPWWSFNHTELKDDRMLLFANHLPAGIYTYSYTARATTIGEFQLPPTHAEAMYAPEQFGHGASSKVRVIE